MTRLTRSILDDFPSLRRPTRATLAGLWAERLLVAFWPALTILGFALSAILFGLMGGLSGTAVLVLSAAVAALLVTALVVGARKFTVPTLDDAIRRIDKRLPGRPIGTLTDTLAMGAEDPGTAGLWRAHLHRMESRLAEAKAVKGAPRLAGRDPVALRLLAALAFVMAVLFGSWDRLEEISVSGASGAATIAGAPSWEGWVEPPGYTGKPALYLADLEGASVTVPVGSRITIRLYGTGEYAVTQTVTGADGGAVTDPSQSYELRRSGELRITGDGGGVWQFNALQDAPPRIAPEGLLEARLSGEWRQPYAAGDDYGVTTGFARIELDLAAVDRRHGLAPEPEQRPAIELDLALPFRGDRRDFEGVLEELLAKHPWAGLPVSLTLGANDAAMQVGLSEPEPIILPARRFFDPLAAALIEQRRDLLWTRENAHRIVQILRAVNYEPGGDFRTETDRLRVKSLVERLEAYARGGHLSPELQDELAELLWELAISIEEGNLSDALERLRQAQDRLEQAMRDGATDQEIDQLMNEFREALRDYMRQLAEQQQQDGNQQPNDNQQMQELSGEQLDQLLDRLQELMEQGRMAEAQQLMEMLRQMMENMQVQQGQPGQQGQGQQALQGLADTLREQQGLSDDTFSDLQEGQGEGQEGENGQQQGNGGDPGQGQQPGDGPGEQMGLADRQQALRDMLNDQLQNLPGQSGEGVRRSLDDAGEAMGRAENSLRDGDLPGALEDQAEAMESLREGMRELSEEMAENQQQGQQGQAMGDPGNPNRSDPLGREAGNGGQVGTDEQLLQGQDVYRRAEELLGELRRRSGERERPQEELDYLERLLDRF